MHIKQKLKGYMTRIHGFNNSRKSNGFEMRMLLLSEAIKIARVYQSTHAARYD